MQPSGTESFRPACINTGNGPVAYWLRRALQNAIIRRRQGRSEALAREGLQRGLGGHTKIKYSRVGKQARQRQVSTLCSFPSCGGGTALGPQGLLPISFELILTYNHWSSKSFKREESFYFLAHPLQPRHPPPPLIKFSLSKHTRRAREMDRERERERGRENMNLKPQQQSTCLAIN